MEIGYKFFLGVGQKFPEFFLVSSSDHLFLTEVWHSLLLGVIQGLSEFFPVSSSGHLFLTEVWLGLVPDINFTILLHVASLGAVILVYRQAVWSLLKSAFDLKAWRTKNLKPDGVLAWQLVMATIFTVGVALLIEPYFKTLLNLEWVALTLIITAFLIVMAEKFGREDTTHFTWSLAIILGLVQGIAVIPGISRSGLTITFLILMGLNRQLAVKISFLLSIPTIIGALVFMLKDQWGSFNFTLATAIGFGASFFTAWLAIVSMKNLVEERWIYFAPYCALLGGGILVWSVWALI